MIDINDLIIYNKQLLINNYYHLCKTNPSNNLCRKVTENTLDNWKSYLDKNQFSKGRDRLETWLYLTEESPFIYIKNNSLYKFIPPEDYQYLTQLKGMKEEKLYFILAGLMIIFQVFGDGNHRTANYFYNKMVDKNITPKQFDKIDEILSNYDYGGNIQRDPLVITDIISKLLDIQQQTGGKKRKIRTMRFKRRQNKTKKRHHRN